MTAWRPCPAGNGAAPRCTAWSRWPGTAARHCGTAFAPSSPISGACVWRTKRRPCPSCWRAAPTSPLPTWRPPHASTRCSVGAAPTAGRPDPPHNGTAAARRGGAVGQVDVPWWRDAVVYEIYVRSFADSDGDGVGDLPGITARLPYLFELGVDAVWLTPFYASPMADHGYDVADPRAVDPTFGTLADFDLLLARAHALGL